MNLKENKKIFLIPAIILLAAVSFFLFRNSTKKLQIENRNDNAAENKIETPKYYPDTIPEMSAKEYSGADLKLGKVLADNPAYTRYAITYKSEGWTISGALNIPKGLPAGRQGKGPFPVIFINHGYYDPATYASGRALPREQDFFASNGYVTFLPDYRNYALSDRDPGNDVRPRAGYVEDAINAVDALKQAALPHVDSENIGMLGHSMGGGVTLNVMVIRPDIAKAYVLLAPINSDYKANFDKWVISDFPEAAQQFYDLYGTYAENTAVWDSLSARNYFSEITAPILLHQGTADSQVPLQWSQELDQLLKNAGKDITYYEYPGEDHVFMKAQNLVMQRTLAFFNAKLRQK